MKAYPILLSMLVCMVLQTACKKQSNNSSSTNIYGLTFTVNGTSNGSLAYTSYTTTPIIRFSFSMPVQSSGFNSNFSFVDQNNTAIPLSLIHI